MSDKASERDTTVSAAPPDTDDVVSTRDKPADNDIGIAGVESVKELLRHQSPVGHESRNGISLWFQDLSVSASHANAVDVKNLKQAILNTFGPDQISFLKQTIWSYFFPPSAPRASNRILKDCSGLVKPGEMLLVLGRPGSGCSTFLRTIANRSPLPVTGNLEYENIPASVFAKDHSRETIYLPEEDRHVATLTVRQTINFALRNSMSAQNGRPESIRDIVEAIAKLFGLSHALDTPVGGQFSPGVSGGERKRVSIAEVLAAGSSVQCFDNSTRGLDSSTALDFVKALRAFTSIGHKTTLATLYQAGESLYNSFDKVIVLDEGHQAFFGPVSEARKYFEDLGFVPVPGQTTAEFLVGLTDSKLRQVRIGSKAEAIRSPEDLAAAFRSSTSYKQLQENINDSRRAQRDTSSLSTDAYQLSFPSQVRECLTREFQLIVGQRRVYYIKWFTTVILCLACGSVYFDIDNTAQGAFTRGGILYFALIFNGWLQFPELFDAHSNRPVVERQARLHLCRPSAVAVARFLIDLPLIAFQHVIFIIIFYFLSRLQIEAGKFFFFYLTLFISTVCFSNLLRMFAYYVGTLDDCFRYGGFSCTVLLLFAGFLIPPNSMSPVFGWLHYLNPMFYGFENLFSNEFTGLQLSCENNLVPANGVSGHQTCAIKGALAGQTTVPGTQYLESFGFSASHRWRNIGIMISIAVIYLLVGILGSELMSFTTHGGAPLVLAKRRNSKSPSALEDVEKIAPTSASASITSGLKAAPSNRGEYALTWRDINVNINEAHILKGISGYVKRGELTALCGASGAGKTTLLTALSQTNFSGQVDGEVLVGNRPPGPTYRKKTGFAQQMDLHEGTATVREALEFSAVLRQPAEFTKAERLAYVDEVLRLLDLVDVQDVLIEDGAGLGVERLKRVTIGVELASRPEILFADEPTSGLDSQGAAHIVDYLKILARQGQAILVTIHQPSALLFSQFDNLLALSSEGQQLFFGKVTEALPYFARNGAVAPDGVNPGEFILETVGAGFGARTNDKASNWAATWSASSEASELGRRLDAHRGAEAASSQNDDQDTPVTEFNATVLEQTIVLTKRMLLNQWRSPAYMYSKIWVHVTSAILVGFTFFQIGTSPQDLQNRMLSVFFILFLCNAIVNVILARYFFASLHWLLREGPSHAYGWVAFASSVILSEMPGAVLVTVLYFVLWYFPSGLPLGGQAAYIFLFLLTYEIFQVLLGLFMMALSPDLGGAGNILVFIVCTCNWFNGIIVPYHQIQVFWRYWLYYLSPFTYLLGGMVTAVTSSAVVSCADADITRFLPPPNQSCSSYASGWADSASAQLLNPDAFAPTECQVCQWSRGEQFLAQFNLGGGQLGGQWGCWGIFMIFTVSNLFLVYFFTWATKVRGWKLFYFF
ncbi:hypothetical protein Purlil1_31 [Purpureocillium lilacinum]|uniref:ABC transporter domain-containing protein n=1 Tax=Purpureocillium lilacinum TaxID=33203 RepID=A0ABR0CG80_PURLI|nr:hypothetical protein Purlil1_31 [Purpureocillium lilacinum]